MLKQVEAPPEAAAAPAARTGLEWIARNALRALLWVQPDGWQARARRNARSSMLCDRQRRAKRLETERSISLVMLARQERAAAI